MMGSEVMELGKRTADQIDHPLLKRLEDLRERMGLSRERFAVHTLDVSYPTYHRWVKGGFRNIALKTFEQLEELVTELEAELEPFILCRSANEVARVDENSDQPNRDGPCPICTREDCEWEMTTRAEIEGEYMLDDAPLINILNHGAWYGRNWGELIEGTFESETEALRAEVVNRWEDEP